MCFAQAELGPSYCNVFETAWTALRLILCLGVSPRPDVKTAPIAHERSSPGGRRRLRKRRESPCLEVERIQGATHERIQLRRVLLQRCLAMKLRTSLIAHGAVTAVGTLAFWWLVLPQAPAEAVADGLMAAFVAGYVEIFAMWWGL